MQANRSVYHWAAGVVVFAVLAQGLYWLLFWWDVGTFGPPGEGTKSIQSFFGKDVSVGTVLPKLDFFIRAAMLLAIGLLAVGSFPTEQTRREMRRREIERRYSGNPFA